MRYAMNVTVNVKPVYANIVHSAIWEGPCRCGEAQFLDPINERRSGKENATLWQEELRQNLASCARILEPVYLEYDETFTVSQEQLDLLRKEGDEIDLYLVRYRVPGIDGLGKPISMIDTSCTAVDVVAFYHDRGLPAYLTHDYDEYNQLLTYLQIKKAIANTRILVLTAGEQVPFAVNSCCTDMRHLTERYGIRSTRLPLLSVMDYFDEEEDVSQEAAQLSEKAQSCLVPSNWMEQDVRYFHAVRRMMEHFDCNAFTTACKEFCATRVPAKYHIVPCLAHCLNKDDRIPSSCEEDINVLMAIMVFMYLAKKSVFMGNPALVPAHSQTCKELGIPEMNPEEVYTEDLLEITHAVPGCRLDGFDAPELPFEIWNFTHEGWGSKVQVNMARHEEKTVTIGRFSRSGDKLMIARGTVVGCRFNELGCSPSVFYTIKGGPRAFRQRLAWGGYGHHLAVVYGDYADQLWELSKIVGFELESFN